MFFIISIFIFIWKRRLWPTPKPALSVYFLNYYLFVKFQVLLMIKIHILTPGFTFLRNVSITHFTGPIVSNKKSMYKNEAQPNISLPVDRIIFEKYIFQLTDPTLYTCWPIDQIIRLLWLYHNINNKYTEHSGKNMYFLCSKKHTLRGNFSSMVLMNSCPLHCLTYPHLGNQRACSTQGSSSSSQLRRPPSQKKHFTLSAKPTIITVKVVTSQYRMANLRIL